MSAQDEYQKRRTFAIISHPDAGKTTLTEKLLLFGGAIHLAGDVKAKGERRRAHSDWMKIEQARGISVTTSVMTFEYGGMTFNLLDTPGHEDFSDDTYRTLTAVDSAVMVIDAAKGIEAQTRKLFEVCRLRDVPIITFVNKMDRETRDPFDLLDEITETLALDTTPMTWPVDQGKQFKGCYDLIKDEMIVFENEKKGELPEIMACKGTDDEKLKNLLSDEQHAKLQEDVEMVRGLCPAFDLESYRQGHLSPVYFGSALKNFGVKDLLDGIKDLAPPPRVQATETREVKPEEPKVSGFVFKVQANMDPKHRDRIAFVRLCSGKFKRGMKLLNTVSNKTIGVSNPIFFFSQGRELAEEAVAGDIIGIPNHGTLRVGDTLSENEKMTFTGIPDFAPEILRRVRLGDPMKAKHLQRALESLAEEGVTQVFRPVLGSEWIIGVGGTLQLDVLANRLESEYDLEVIFEPTQYVTARWVTGANDEVKKFSDGNRASLGQDRDETPVYLARNDWDLGRIQEDWPDLKFSATRERGH
ncbi:MAG: peptide chain release factor 3 [Alphaproteobacteria bacterium]|nr:peptide chain release factor 3 [Alphaproteobacteria bacterium]